MTRISTPGNTPRTHEVRRIGSPLKIHPGLSENIRADIARCNAALRELPSNLYAEADVEEVAANCKDLVSVLAAIGDATIANLRRHIEVHEVRHRILQEVEKQYTLMREAILEKQSEARESIGHVEVTTPTGVATVTTPTLRNLDHDYNTACLKTVDEMDCLQGKQLAEAKQQLLDFVQRIKRSIEV